MYSLTVSRFYSHRERTGGNLDSFAKFVEKREPLPGRCKCRSKRSCLHGLSDLGAEATTLDSSKLIAEPATRSPMEEWCRKV